MSEKICLTYYVELMNNKIIIICLIIKYVLPYSVERSQCRPTVYCILLPQSQQTRRRITLAFFSCNINLQLLFS